MNTNHKPSSFLTIASLKNNPAGHSAGESVSIYKNGRKDKILSLKKNTTQTFRAQDGKVTVRIEDGKAWVSESTCRHKICLYSPPVSLAGERIVCAPNHFLLEVQRSGSIDTIIG
jgi:hypothetical protein